MSMVITRSARRLLPALLLAMVAGCVINPVTGQRQFVLLTEAQEIQMGEQGAAQVVNMIGLVPDSALQQYVRTLGVRMAAATERPRLPWTFGVIDDPTPNAFAMPGGFIFFTRGIMALFESEAQFAAVLGHEIAHVTARHSVTAITRAQLAQLGLGVGVLLVPELEPFGGLAAVGLELMFLRNSREAEREADEHGFRYTLQQGYDAGEMVEVFETLRRLGEAESRSPLPGWLLTHPTPAERVEATRAKAAAEIPDRSALRSGREDYLNRIGGLVYGDDPRQGIFEENVFMHPDLRFRLDFPSGWAGQNTAHVVLAGSPRQDAVIQLTIEQGPADQAASRFLGHQGVTSAGAVRETVNGIPALTASFQAQAQQGVLAGTVTWLDFGGRTFQILGVTPANAFAAHQAAFRATSTSFRELTDARVLGLRPDRIHLVRLPEAMTLTQFHQRYTSTISLQELAIINQVASPTTTLAAGRLVKRVAP